MERTGTGWKANWTCMIVHYFESACVVAGATGVLDQVPVVRATCSCRWWWVVIDMALVHASGRVRMSMIGWMATVVGCCGVLVTG